MLEELVRKYRSELLRGQYIDERDTNAVTVERSLWDSDDDDDDDDVVGSPAHQQRSEGDIFHAVEGENNVGHTKISKDRTMVLGEQYITEDKEAYLLNDTRGKKKKRTREPTKQNTTFSENEEVGGASAVTASSVSPRDTAADDFAEDYGVQSGELNRKRHTNKDTRSSSSFMTEDIGPSSGDEANDRQQKKKKGDKDERRKKRKKEKRTKREKSIAAATA
jgi:hypothetical protein